MASVRDILMNENIPLSFITYAEKLIGKRKLVQASWRAFLTGRPFDTGVPTLVTVGFTVNNAPGCDLYVITSNPHTMLSDMLGNKYERVNSITSQALNSKGGNNAISVGTSIPYVALKILALEVEGENPWTVYTDEFMAGSDFVLKPQIDGEFLEQSNQEGSSPPPLPLDPGPIVRIPKRRIFLDD